MDEIKFLHLSDLHNEPESRKRLQYIAKHYPNHVLLITGDLTHDGTARQYNWVWEILHRMPNDYIVVPGNHDWAGAGNFDRQEKAWRFDDTFGTQFIPSSLPSIWAKQDIAIYGLNSNPGTFGYFLDFARGKIGKKQRKHLEGLFWASRGRTNIVLLHHHLQDPFTTGWRRWWYKITRRLMELSDSTQLCKVLQGRCDLVLHGHRHSQYSYKVGDIPVYCAGALYNQTEVLEITIGDKVETKYVPIV